MQTEKTVATPSPEALAMQADWDLMTALLGGTRAMRAAGETYLPKRNLEEQADYKIRLERATLFPATSKTVREMAGRVFGAPLIESDDVPDWISDEVLTNVDRQGRNLQAWAAEWFRRGLAHGLCHVLVDSPASAPGATVADQKAAGVRPYAMHIDKNRVLGWKVDDKGKLLQVRIAFERSEPDGPWSTKTVPQVRVYEPGKCEVWEEGADKKWAKVDDIKVGVKGIPLVTFYTERTATMQADPPLRELAYLNVKHWQQQSSLDTLLDTACVPILAISGGEDDGKVVIGARSAVKLPVGGDMKFVEHSGKAIDSGRNQLQDLQEQMRQAGAKLLQKEQVKTATQSGEESMQANSPLATMVMDFEDALALLLDTVAAWRGESVGGKVKCQPNLDPDFQPAESMGVLTGMVSVSALSRQTLFAEAQRRGMIDEAAEWEAEQVRIQEEGGAPAPTSGQPGGDQ